MTISCHNEPETYEGPGTIAPVEGGMSEFRKVDQCASVTKAKHNFQSWSIHGCRARLPFLPLPIIESLQSPYNK